MAILNMSFAKRRRRLRIPIGREFFVSRAESLMPVRDLHARKLRTQYNHLLCRRRQRTGGPEAQGTVKLYRESVGVAVVRSDIHLSGQSAAAALKQDRTGRSRLPVILC